jgi:hypothetical protein
MTVIIAAAALSDRSGGVISKADVRQKINIKGDHDEGRP